MAVPPTNLTPMNLVQDFNHGWQAAAPANVVPPQPIAPVPPQLSPAGPTYPPAGVGTPPPVWDASPPVQHAPVPPVYTPEAASPLVAGPAAPATVAPADTAPAGPLPAYGADIRPAAAAVSTPSAPLSPPPPPAPASAAVQPATGHVGVGQPAVVRRPAWSPQAQSPPGVGTEAVVVTAGGGIVGATSAEATARARLQRFVDAVARQQPRLGWAAGDRSDDTTVLVTDLAGGWIPPHVDLPAAVTLLDPATRRGDLETLLGDVKVVATYTPVHYIPEEDEPVAFSPRPRQAPQIDELGWELGEATHWRDGLPRLAHTLARAAWSGTGMLDSEIEMLHEYLAETAGRVLDSYPDNVDPYEVGNWQLLAAIDALIAGDRTAANYHLAWFQACTMTTTENVGP